MSQPPADHDKRMGHGGTVLFVAQLEGGRSVPPRPSSATATGAFLVDSSNRTVSYDLTFHGLESGPPNRIALHNFGVGGNGPLIHAICGADSVPCPRSRSANVMGTWDGKGPVNLDNNLLSEFASGRVYVEVVAADGRPEIRGQLEPNGAMVPVRNFVAHLIPAPGSKTKGTGTAVLSETHFPDGRVSVFYHATVAGTAGTPKEVALVRVPPSSTGAVPLSLPKPRALPKQRLMPSREPKTGGTLTGQYETNRKDKTAIFSTQLLAAGAQPAIVIRTDKFPDGELYGALKPVN